MADDALLYRWLDLVKSPDGPPDPVLRLVCLLVGSWMKNADAPQAQLALGTLSDQAGIAKRNLRERIRQLEGVWLDVDRPPGKRPLFRPRIPDAGATVPSVSELRSGGDSGVENSATPVPRIRGVLAGDPGSMEPGWGVRRNRGPRFDGTPDTYSLPTSSLGARAGEGDPSGPAGGAPGAGSEQLPMPRLLSKVIQGLKEDDQEAVDDAIRRMKEAARG